MLQLSWKTRKSNERGQCVLVRKNAPTNSGFGGSNMQGYDPILISLVRRQMPNLIAYDICCATNDWATGLIFAMKSKFSTQGGTEALFNEPDVGFSNDDAAGDLNSTAMTGDNPAVLNDASPGTYLTGGDSYGSQTGGGMTTAEAEALGDAST